MPVDDLLVWAAETSKGRMAKLSPNAKPKLRIDEASYREHREPIDRLPTPPATPVRLPKWYDIGHCPTACSYRCSLHAPQRSPHPESESPSRRKTSPDDTTSPSAEYHQRNSRQGHNSQQSESHALSASSSAEHSPRLHPQLTQHQQQQQQRQQPSSSTSASWSLSPDKPRPSLLSPPSLSTSISSSPDQLDHENGDHHRPAVSSPPPSVSPSSSAPHPPHHHKHKKSRLDQARDELMRGNVDVARVIVAEETERLCKGSPNGSMSGDRSTSEVVNESGSEDEVEIENGRESRNCNGSNHGSGEVEGDLG